MKFGMKWVKKANMWCVWTQEQMRDKMKQEMKWFSTEEEANKYLEEIKEKYESKRMVE